MASVNETLFDAGVRHAVALERFKGGEAKRLAGAYKELEADLLARLAKHDPTSVKGRYMRARLELLLRETREVIRAFTGQMELDFNATMRDLAGTEAALHASFLQGAVLVGIDWAVPAVSQVRAAVFAEPMQGRFLKEWFQTLAVVTQDRVKAAIRLGVLEGQTVRDIGLRIRNATGQSRRGAEMVVRTAVNHVSQVARQQVYQENADIVKGVRWVATLDGRTSAVCRARDGEVYPLDSGPRPPAHPGCRSSTSPVLKSWRELGIDLDDAPEGMRASMDGQVPASTTYPEWLKRQPAAVQDDILGVQKGALFRRGGLTLDRFVAADGSELNLDGLRAKYPQAFGRAGLNADSLARTSTGAAFPVIADIADSDLLSAPQNAIRRDLLEKARPKPVEWMAGYDRETGKTFEAYTDDKQRAVAMRGEIWDAANDGKRTGQVEVHHNHPSGSTLSPADFQLAQKSRLASIYAHGHDGSVFRGRVLPFQNFDKAYDNATDALIKAKARIPKSDRILQEAATSQSDHITFKALAKAGVIEYEYRLGSRTMWLADIDQKIDELASRVAKNL